MGADASGTGREEAAELADLFILLVRRLESQPDESRAIAESHEARPERLKKPAIEALTVLETEGVDGLAAWLERPAEAGELFRVERAMVAAQAIDLWHRPLAAWYDAPAGTSECTSEFSPPSPGSRSSGLRIAARRFYNRRSRFNSDAADGQVILRPGLLARSMNIREAIPPASFQIADLFQTLLFVPPTLPVEYGGESRSVALAFRRVPGVGDQNLGDPDWTPVIGIVPLLLAEADMELHHFDRGGETWYNPVPCNLGLAAAAAIDALARQGANLILFPETSILHPEALDAIKVAMRRNAVDGPIRYVIAPLSPGPGQPGTAEPAPLNQVVVLDRTGAEVARQAKLHGWDLDAEQCRSYGLHEDAGGPLSGAREFMDPGDSFTIFELPDLGRLAVTICEDLERVQPGAWIAQGMMVDWLVTPVMDGGLTTERWQARAGAESSRAGYCRVVVANSMTLSHRFNRACQDRDGDHCQIRDCGVALLFQPRADPDSPPHVACLTLPLDHPEPGWVVTPWEPGRWPQLKTDREESGS